MAPAELFWRAFGWLTMVWFVSAALFVILMQLFLPLAWKELRARPPHGSGWAHTLWYQRSRVYGALMALAFGLGLLAAALFLFA